MPAKRYIGRLISLKFTDRKTPIAGYVVDYNDEWTLMKWNPVDYVIDGFAIVRHKNISGVRRGVAEKFGEKVLKLKGVKIRRSDAVPLTDLETILRHLTDKFGLFLLYTKSETACYVGRLKSIDKRRLEIASLNSRGKWDRTVTFRLGDIRVVEFGSDYLDSLRLVAKIKPGKS